MKIYSVPKDPSVIGIKDVNHAIISPMIEYLNKDDKVIIARYVEKHPELEDPAIVIQTIGDDTAKNAVRRAINKIQSQFLSIDISSDKLDEHNAKSSASMATHNKEFGLPGDEKPKTEKSYGLPGDEKPKTEKSYGLPGDEKPKTEN